MTHTSAQDWIVFGTTIAAALAVDQLLFHRHARRISVRRALVESACWIGLSLAFSVWVYWSLGRNSGTEFLASYVLEKSLSLDNIFVFLMIFSALQIPPDFQPKALYGGILGALLLRAAFVVAGLKLLSLFHPLAYILGGFLVIVGIRMLLRGARTVHPEKSWILRVAQKLFPVTDRYDGGKFFLREDGKLKGTPLLLALIVLEAMDIVFAADSIPAVLSITRNTFVAYSSNAFAVLGLHLSPCDLRNSGDRNRCVRAGSRR
jgi:TerC family integral membrane protein